MHDIWKKNGQKSSFEALCKWQPKNTFMRWHSATTWTRRGGGGGVHTIYTRNNMGQECEGNCGLWVLNEILKKTYPENLKKIVGAVLELPAK